MRDIISKAMKWFPRWAGPLALLSLTGCLPFLRPPQVPLKTLELAAGEPTSCLAILLLGRFGGPRDYVEARFVGVAREQGVALDLIAVDAHLGYYRDRSVIDRLREDVVRPAQERGYEEIWLVGTSLGGLGTLLYAREHGDDLMGVLALAPFLGKEELIEEIQQRGGVRAWARGIGPYEDDLRKLWLWLESRPADAVPLHLAFGTGDRLADANTLLAELLPEDQVLRTPGGHDWKVWRGLWEQFLARDGVCSESQDKRPQGSAP